MIICSKLGNITLNHSPEELRMLFEVLVCGVPTATQEANAVAESSKSQRRMRYIAKSDDNQAETALKVGKR